LVPPDRDVRASAAPRSRRPPEREILEVAAAHLRSEGFRTYRDVDGTDYFDLVARRGEEVGLIEGKVADARTVIVQALRRRAWGNWVAVVLGSRTSATRLERRTAATRAAPVGIWAVEHGALTVLRPAAAWAAPGEDDPFRELRLRFRRILDAVDRGEIPAGVRWSDVNREVRRAAGGRRFAEWRLDEGRSRPD
jgi:hypothetical protein